MVELVTPGECGCLLTSLKHRESSPDSDWVVTQKAHCFWPTSPAQSHSLPQSPKTACWPHAKCSHIWGERSHLNCNIFPLLYSFRMAWKRLMLILLILTIHPWSHLIGLWLGDLATDSVPIIGLFRWFCVLMNLFQYCRCWEICSRRFSN